MQEESLVFQPVKETLEVASSSGGKSTLLGICLASSLLEFLIVKLQSRKSMSGKV